MSENYYYQLYLNEVLKREEEQRRHEEERKHEEEQRKHEEEQRKHEEAQRLLEEEQRRYQEERERREEEMQRRIAAEQHAQEANRFMQLYLQAKSENMATPLYSYQEAMERLTLHCRESKVNPITAPFSYHLQDRDSHLSSVTQVMMSNIIHRNSKDQKMHHFMFFPGGSGIGKTRLGQECANITPQRFSSQSTYRLGNLSSQEKQDICSAFSNVHYVYVNLHYGFPFHAELDSLPAGIRMGVRIATCGILQVSSDCVLSAGKAVYSSLQCRPVLADLIRRSRAQKKLHDADVLTLALHIDEFQIYESSLFRNMAFLRHMGEESPREMFKAGLDEIGSFMVSPPPDLQGKFVLVPIVTGTSAFELSVLRTKFGRTVIVPTPLTERGAMEMASQKYSHLPTWETIKQSSEFRIALSDTGYVPHLIELMLHLPPEHGMGWGEHLWQLIVAPPDSLNHHISFRNWSLDLFFGHANARRCLLFAMANLPLSRNCMLSNQTLHEMEKNGALFLFPASNVNEKIGPFDPEYNQLDESLENPVYIHIPFIVARMINYELYRQSSGTILPDQFWFSPTMTRPYYWQDFELLLPYWIQLRCLAFSEWLRTRKSHYEHNRVVLLSNINQSSPMQLVANRERNDATLRYYENALQRGFPLDHVFTSVLCADTSVFKQILCQINPYRTISQESTQRVSSVSDQFKVDTTTLDSSGKSYSMANSIVQCAPGNALVDTLVLFQNAAKGDRNVIVFIQTKHSQRLAKTVSSQVISTWYAKMEHATQAWQREFEVAYLWISNRKLSGSLNMQSYPRLGLLMQDQLETFLTNGFWKRIQLVHAHP